MTIVDPGPIWKVDVASMRMWIDFSHSLDPLLSVGSADCWRQSRR
jgi:hypothetical protein